MAAHDSTRTPVESPARSKAKARALTLRPHEARRLAEAGEALIVREVELVQFGPSGTPGYDWNFRRGPGGVWEDYRTSELLSSKHCPLGPVGSMLWGREAWSPDHAAFYPHFPHVYKADGQPAAWEIENGRVYGDETKEWYPFRWRSSTSMPRHASRFPRLRHESCEVKRARAVSEDEVHQSGAYLATHVLYNGSLTCDDWRLAHRNVLDHYSPGAWDEDRWLWCSLVRKVD